MSVTEQFNERIMALGGFTSKPGARHPEFYVKRADVLSVAYEVFGSSTDHRMSDIAHWRVVGTALTGDSPGWRSVNLEGDTANAALDIGDEVVIVPATTYQGAVEAARAEVVAAIRSAESTSIGPRWKDELADEVAAKFGISGGQ